VQLVFRGDGPCKGVPRRLVVGQKYGGQLVFSINGFLSTIIARGSFSGFRV
jgi:hypothetical protein